MTPDVVRAWGYDENLLLSSCDEDLLLYDEKHVPTLLELAEDERCPKRDYAFGILCQFTRERIVRSSDPEVAALRRVAEALPAKPDGKTAEWLRYLERLVGYTRPAGEVDKDGAKRMAADLLLGIEGREGDVVEEEPPSTGWWRFGLRTSMIERLDIFRATGEFRYQMSFSG